MLAVAPAEMQHDENGFGRLVAAARPIARAETLVVYFNVYLNRAHGRPDLPLETRFDALRGFLPLHAHLVWFAEERETWYLAHEARILDMLEWYVRANRIAQVKFVGGSAGGYAALRFGMLLDRRLAGRGDAVPIIAFATNPQTGFSDRLLGTVRGELAAAGWDPALLGCNPIVLAPELRAAFAGQVLDLSELARRQPAANFAALVLNDEDNPIERAFTRDIADWAHLHHAAQFLGIGHGEGAERLYREAFWPVFDAVWPLARDAGAETRMVPLA